MAEIEGQNNKESKMQKQVGLWASGVFIALSLAFLIFSIYIVEIVQKGRFDLSDMVLVPTAAIMTIVSVSSFILIKRKRLALGANLIFYFVCLAPAIIATLLLDNFGIFASLYNIVLASIMIAWILPKEFRRFSIIATLVAILINIGIELWSPAFRIGTDIGNFTTIVTVLAGLTLLVILFQQAWKRFNVQAKLLSSISIVSMVLIGVLTAGSVTNLFQQAEENEHQKLTAIYQNYNTYVNTLEDTAASLAISLADRQDALDLYQNRNRQGLIDLLTPLFNDLKNNYNIVHMYIEDPDGTVFVRVHNPDNYGDDITYRRTAAAALESKQPVAGVEIGPGRLGVRGVAPMYENGHFIGMVEVGIDYDQTFLENLKESTGVDYTMWITNDAAKPAGLLPPEDAPAAPTDSLFFYASTYQNNLEVPENVYNRVLDTGSTETYYLDDGSQELVIFVTPLLGYGDRTIGIIEIITSRAPTLALIQDSFINSLGIAAIVSVIGFLSLIFVAQGVILRPLAKLTGTSREQLAGDLTARVPTLANDEFGELGSTLNALSESLQESVLDLEKRVNERTAELDQASKQIERRADQFESIAQVSRIISSIQNLDDLLPRITHMISQSFGFYHTGIFLLDEYREYAVLRAANSEGGRRMLDRGHRLAVGQSGLVGYATGTGSPRIALDTGSDAVYFDNPDLPDTRSEMALPLKAGGRVIGALDVQSKEPNAFTPEDVNILSALADQVSTAIQNARLFQESREALLQAEKAYRQLTNQTWSDLQRITPVIGYRYDGTNPEPLKRPLNEKLAKEQQDALSIPVQLRGETIGTLRIHPTSKGYQWTEDDLIIIRATAERVALAAENARLVLDSQKRASKEQIIGDISSKIGAAINLDNILQTTLREMGRILPGAEISIKVEND